MKIIDVDNHLENISRIKARVNLEDIDDVVNKIKHILIEPAHDLKMIKKKRRHYVKKPNKQTFFDDECKQKQKLFNKARNKDRQNPDDIQNKHFGHFVAKYGPWF